MEKASVVSGQFLTTNVQQAAGKPRKQEGVQRCFYTLWGRDDERIWEPVPDEDLVGSILEGTGRQDWRKLRPFDLLPDINSKTGGVAYKLLYVGDYLRMACDHVVGPQPIFERAGDYETIFFQFSGASLVETSFDSYELRPGEALLIPAMVAHRTIGTANCRRLIFYAKDRLEARLDPDKAITDIRYAVHRVADPVIEEAFPSNLSPPNGKTVERLSHWDRRPGEVFFFRRTYEGIVGKAESGRRPTKVRPFDYFSTPPDSPKAAVRGALLWESATFKQRVYANPGWQPAPHRGYDEDEWWFQFKGRIDQESEHGVYSLEPGEASMAEAGISHTSNTWLGGIRLVAYTSSPIRMIVDPGEHLRETHWEVRETIVRGWQDG